MSAAPAPQSLILTRADIRSLMEPADWVTAVETGFRAAATGNADSPPPMTIVRALVTAGSVLRSAASNAHSTRRRMSVASSMVFRPGACGSHSAWPK